MKLMDKMLDIDATLFPRACTQALVAVAKQQDDPFYRYCLEFLARFGEFGCVKIQFVYLSEPDSC